MHKSIVLLAAWLGHTFATAQELPPPHYENWGVCPFECCTYREWTANEAIAVHAERNETSPLAFRVRKGERVDAVTGVVVTDKPGVIVVDKPVRDGFVPGNDKPQLDLKAGDTVYLLTPLGEGFYLFWYRGKVYRSGIGMAAMPGVDGQAADTVWWKQIQNKAGKRGWTRSDNFDHVDACG